MATPEEVYRAFLDGDEAAFEELIRQFRQPVTAFIRRFVPDPDAAQDVAQDVFVEVLEKRNFRFASGLRSWLFAIARHKAIDYIRKHKRVMPLEDLPAAADHRPGPEEEVIARERRERAKRALEQLKDDRRLALVLTAAEGLSYEEAAAVLHKTPDQIKNLCYRGRQQLRQAMKEVGEDD